MTDCDMGVGCSQAGVCYAQAHAEPHRCSLLQAHARYCYEHSDNQVKPTWDQIGDTTRGVWIEIAMDPSNPAFRCPP